MDRMLVFAGQVALPLGHRIEVTEHDEGEGRESIVLSVVDLDTGIRYRRGEEARGALSRWIGRVLECTVTVSGGVTRTALLVDPVGPAASEAGVALRGADAAVEAAKAEADRWGGTDRPPAEEPERFW
ncbi:hypothetical protein AB0872_05745 [Microbacterium sp. NPDC047426]